MYRNNNVGNCVQIKQNISLALNEIMQTFFTFINYTGNKINQKNKKDFQPMNLIFQTEKAFSR